MALIFLLALFVSCACATSCAYKACGTDYTVTYKTPVQSGAYYTFYYEVKNVACDTVLNNITVNLPTCQNCSTVNKCYDAYWNAEQCCSTPSWQTRDAFYLAQNYNVSGWKFSNLKFSESGTIRFSIYAKTSQWQYGYVYVAGTTWTMCSAPVPVCTCCGSCGTGTYRLPSATDCSCQTCLLCPTGTYVTSPCTNTSNTVCSSCTNCTAGMTYQTQTCSSTANSVCTNCTNCVAGVTYQTSNCTATANRVCKNCSTCVPGLTYQSANCNATSNRICNNCTTCVAGVTYEAANCTATSNRVCNNCTTCLGNVTYQARACNATADRLCSPCTPCTLGVTYQTSPCNTTSNRVCNNCTTCVAGVTYQAEACNATSNRVCNNCTTCTPGVTYQAYNCTPTMNRICNNCTTCLPGVTYESQTCNATSNRVCTNCTTCVRGITYEAEVCNATHNRVCAQCSNCSVNEQVLYPCNATNDVVCVPCPACAACGANAHLINNGLNCSCDVGFVRDNTTVNYTCIPQPCCLDCLACNFNASQNCQKNDPSLCNYTCYPSATSSCSSDNATAASTGFSLEGPYVTFDFACCGVAVPQSCSCYTYQLSTTNDAIDTFILGTSCPLSLCDVGVATPCVASASASNGVTPIFTILSTVDPNTRLGGLELTALSQTSGSGPVNYTILFSGFINVSSIPIIYSIYGPSSQDSEELACLISDIGGPECVQCNAAFGPFSIDEPEIFYETSLNASRDNLVWYALGASIPVGILLIGFTLFAVRKRALKDTTNEKA